MLDDRKLTVLRAIVEDYVSTTEPVGSKSLVDRHHFDVSPATIRNDMAVLEEQGFIAQPHTSAGRIPTDKGYRLFVDRLSSVKPLSAAERRAIETFLAGAYNLDDVVMRTVRLLVQLTRQVAVVQYPSLTRSAIRHIELVPLAPQKLLLVLITDTGRVEQCTVDLPDPWDDASVSHVRAVVNTCLGGHKLSDAAAMVTTSPSGSRPGSGRTPTPCSRCCWPAWSSGTRKRSSSAEPLTWPRTISARGCGKCLRPWKNRWC